MSISNPSTGESGEAIEPSPPSIGSAVGGRRNLLSKLSHYRRYLSWGLLLVPTISVVVIDFMRRGERLAKLTPQYQATYAYAVLESIVVWSILLYAASRRRGWSRWLNAVLFVVALTFSFGGQKYFYDQYNAYLNVDVSLFASNFMDSVANQLFADIGNYLKAKLPWLITGVALIVVGRIILRPQGRPARVASVLAPLCLVASFFVPVQHRHLQAATPDTLYLHAVGGLIRTQAGWTKESNQMRPRVRESLPVPQLTSKVDKPRNVLFLILESVRADATCNDGYEEGCKKTQYTNELVKNRIAQTQMRSMASCTAISLAVMWSGLSPVESRDNLHTWPLIFDYAKAAGWDRAFWTSQNMMFGNARLWVKNLGVSQFISATDLDPTSDLDMGAPEHLLAKHVNDNIGKLKEPWLGVVQFSNVHYPYYLDPNGPKPFKPYTTSKAPDDNPYFFNLYKNTVHQQDRHVASIIKNLRATEAGKRTIIVYTSDHAEAFREHNQMGHTFSVFDEEIKVPAWIDAPPGLLTAEEEANLKAKRDEFVFHVDYAPTILDLMGVLDDPGVAKYKTKMPGHSLLRKKLTDQPVAMTNCAGVWSCAFENWGYMQANMKIEARAWDTGWHCFDLKNDPFEKFNLGESNPDCARLKAEALKTFGRLPGKRP